MPLMTPDAGGNGAGLGSFSRGYSFVCEKGDSVLVSFLDRDLFHPFVMGSMFHGKNAKLIGGGVGNHVKTITDKSGGQIILNTDEGGAWGITIHDRNGNTINLDTKGKSINIIAPETITLDANNIYINARQNIVSTAGTNLQNSAGNDILQSANRNIVENSKDRKEVASGEYVRDARKSDIYANEININSTKEDMTVLSAKEIHWNSAEKSNLF